MSKMKCWVCGTLNDGAGHYCPECKQAKIAAIKRFGNGRFEPGDEKLLNAGALRRRVDEHGRVACFKCKQMLPATAYRVFFRKDANYALPTFTYCLTCEATVERKARPISAAGTQNVIQMPRDRPPSADAARQLRAVLDDIGRSLSRLESLAASHQLTQIGDEAERRTLASQLLRLANAATDLTGRLSGITTGGGHENHERSAEIRNIR